MAVIEQQPTMAEVLMQSPDAAALAEKMREGCNALRYLGVEALPGEMLDDAELVKVPFDKHRLDESLLLLPGRRPSRRSDAELIAQHLNPALPDEARIIAYERDRVQLCRWIRYSRRAEIVLKTQEREEHDWRRAIEQQGPWDPLAKPVSLKGTPAVPMPVEIVTAPSLAPLFNHLKNNGNHEDNNDGNSIEEPYYSVNALEFEQGVVYADRRLDLCKVGLGSCHIGDLMKSLRANTYIKHVPTRACPVSNRL